MLFFLWYCQWLSIFQDCHLRVWLCGWSEDIVCVCSIQWIFDLLFQALKGWIYYHWYVWRSTESIAFAQHHISNALILSLSCSKSKSLRRKIWERSSFKQDRFLSCQRFSDPFRCSQVYSHQRLAILCLISKMQLTSLHDIIHFR